MINNLQQFLLELGKGFSFVGRQLPATWRLITVKQLLGHTSGLPDVENNFTGGLVGNKGEDTAWKIVKTMPLQFPKGEQFPLGLIGIKKDPALLINELSFKI